MALSQSIEIGLPAPNQRLSKGANVTVQIQRPNNQSGSKEMAVAIGIYSCPTSECFTPDETMGTILYVGSFDPKYHEFNLPPYQNFTVKLPSDLGAGRAHINIAHATLIGVSEQSPGISFCTVEC